jgi:hypothetical protein
MEELLRSIFEAFPDKSTLTFNGKCSDCKRAVSIHIVPVSQGFGLLGGAFVECSADKYVVKCPDCYKVNSKIIEPYQVNPKSSAIIDKKNILGLVLQTNKRTLSPGKKMVPHINVCTSFGCGRSAMQ